MDTAKVEINKVKNGWIVQVSTYPEPPIIHVFSTWEEAELHLIGRLRGMAKVGS